MFGKTELKKYELNEDELNKLQWAKVTTAKGVIYIKLFNNETPNTVSNFDQFSDIITGYYTN